MKPILTMDFETDPFQHKRRVYPFAWGLYDGQDFASVWSRKSGLAAQQEIGAKVVKLLSKREPSVIYMHNGGRFDIFFLFPWLESDMIIINGRIVKAILNADGVRHEIRDSYAALPFALAAYKKDEIKIEKLETECRESHRAEILSYLRGDCVYLYELVSAFREEFGDYLTIGSAAMAQLQKFHPFEKGNARLDREYRSKFFFGGRVQCFQSGVIDTPFKIYDVNSMYPHVMKNFRHPCGTAVWEDRKIRPKTYFVETEGWNYGAFPQRNPRTKSVGFTTEYGTYRVSIHEWEAALETGSFKPAKILKTFNFDRSIRFGEFVDHFFDARRKAKETGDKLRTLFYKLILNSAYGKFAQNPENFADFTITREKRLAAPWCEHIVHNEGEYVIWKKGAVRHSYFNVAIGASITGAARSVLLRAIRLAGNPLYVDTDSIICGELTGVNLSESELGAWKLEGSGDRLAIAGKKTYVCYDGEKVVKKATKGAKLSADEILAVAQGESVTWRNPAPVFKLDGRVAWVEREIRRTV